MLLRMAWRNLWRNMRRTLLTLAALSLGTAALVFTHAYAESMYSAMIEVATRGFLGHMQVHGEGYNDDPDIYTVVANPETVERKVAEVLPESTVLRRVTGFGLAASDDRSTGAAILGVQPGRERAGTRLITITEGRDLSDEAAHEAVLGGSLAKRLKTSLGRELLLLSQAADGSTANDLYEVVGITAGGGSAEMGESSVFLHLSDAQEFFVLGDGVHQVVVSLHDGTDPKAAAAKLRAAVPSWNDLEVMAWNEMMPEVEIGIEADRQGTFAIDFVVFLIVVLGIFNTMTMATFERIRELGILQSVGMSGRRVMALILTESVLLGLIGLVVGAALGAAITYGIGSIDISSFGEMDFMGVQVPTEIVASIDPLALTAPSVTMLVTCLLGGFWPAYKASRLRPADAVRHV